VTARQTPNDSTPEEPDVPAASGDVGPGEILCQRCDAPRPALERAPFRDARGERIQSQICRICWGEWLQHQTLLINHYGLDPRDPESRAFLYEQIDQVLLGDGSGADAAARIDTSKQGTIDW
jgi:Fe-S cluster biosynthesis and repair protein YggX